MTSLCIPHVKFHGLIEEQLGVHLPWYSRVLNAKLSLDAALNYVVSDWLVPLVFVVNTKVLEVMDNKE